MSPYPGGVVAASVVIAFCLHWWAVQFRLPPPETYTASKGRNGAGRRLVGPRRGLHREGQRGGDQVVRALRVLLPEPVHQRLAEALAAGAARRGQGEEGVGQQLASSARGSTLPLPRALPVEVALQPAAGDAARQPVQHHVARPGVEGEHSSSRARPPR